MPAAMFDYDPKFHDEVAFILAKFKRLDARGARRIARRAQMRATRFLMRQVKTIAPVRTGLLKRRGFQIFDRKGSPGESIRAMSTARRDKLGISAESKWYYPAIVEFGVKKGPRKFAGRKFMSRTYRTHGEAAKKIAIDAMIEGINQEMTTK